MPRVLCPHCRAKQEVEAPTAGTLSRHLCSACAKAFSVRGASGAGSTQKLSNPSPQATDPPDGPLTRIPARMGPYEIRGVIGTGGMGIVYRGWDAQLNRHVAVKTLRSDLARDPEYCERFLREARAAAALSHPNVTQIYFIGEEAGQPFFAMEYLEGKSLETLVREEGKLPSDRAVALIAQAAAGLKAAAGRGIVHRDIKPSNLVLAADGTLKVTDFGLAKLVVSDTGLTMVGEVLGSPNYLAPEQASGGTADLRSDIYSLGATLYELLTGRPPFEGPTPVSIILKHVREPVRSPRRFSPDLPFPLVTLTQRMLAKRPEDRPKDYDALLRELDRLSFRHGSPADVSMPLPSGADPGIIQASSAPLRSSTGNWILIPLLVLGLLTGWGILRQARGKAAQSRFGPDPSADSLPPTPETRVLASSSEVSPQSLGSGGFRRGGFNLAPRLEKMRAAAHANLQFVENTHEITAEGRLRVMGSVANTGGGRATDVRIRVVLTDAVGQVVGSAEVPLTPSLLGPRQSGRFEALFPDPHQSVNIRTELNWNS